MSNANNLTNRWINSESSRPASNVMNAPKSHQRPVRQESPELRADVPEVVAKVGEPARQSSPIPTPLPSLGAARPSLPRGEIPTPLPSLALRVCLSQRERICLAPLPLRIAQRFNAGSRSQEKSKSRQGRKKRVMFAEANRVDPWEKVRMRANFRRWLTNFRFETTSRTCLNVVSVQRRGND